MTRYAAFLSAGLTALAALILYGCQFGTADPQFLLPPDHLLLETNQVRQATDGLMVKADSISVSICPPNADCIAADNVGVKITLSKNGQSSAVRLRAYVPNYRRYFYSNSLSDSTTARFDSKVYKVILRDGRKVINRENVVIQQVVVQVAPL